MSGTVVILIAVLVAWMAACFYCGVTRRFVLFVAVLGAGLGANMAWMVFGLDARPLEVHALVALAGSVVYALCAFLAGLFTARIYRLWAQSRVEG